MIAAPTWSASDLEQQRLIAIDLFRVERMGEPLENYMDAFESKLDAVDDLLEQTKDLELLVDQATAVLSDPRLQEAVRYLAGPPISSDDWKTVADVNTLAPRKLATDTEAAQQLVETVLLGLDRGRFPWIGEGRDADESERRAAAIATSVLMAARHTMTQRAHTSKNAQEQAIKDQLVGVGFVELPTREVATLASAPGPGEFCGECMFGSRKADIVVGLYDDRRMPIECKVSNSSTNSVKRLNNDAAAKATSWLSEFGRLQVVPSAALAGVFKRHNLEQAQTSGLTLWWAHDLNSMLDWISATRS